MTIRTATLSDRPALRELMRASMAGLGQAFYSDDRTRAAAEFLTVPDEALIEDGTLYVAEDECRLVAVGGWSFRAKLFTGSVAQDSLTARLDPSREPARIRAFFVHPDYARRGLARRLFERCEAAAVEAGFTSLSLMATLPGVPLYHALGFEEQRAETIDLPDGTTLDGVQMKKSLR